MKHPLVEAQGLALGWSGKKGRLLASGIQLDLHPGELAILIGPNGSGKSTLLKTLLGLQSSRGGSIRLEGRDPFAMSVEERARLAAWVFNERYDSGYFSVFDIVAFGRYPYTDARGSLTKADRQRVLDSLASVGLAGFEERVFSQLSDGERQKALIARAIAQDCPLLILDEPTAFLDASARVEAFQLARSLARREGRGIILSTHDLDHALSFADQLWLFDSRHGFQRGAPEDLASSGAIGKAFDRSSFRFDAGSASFKTIAEVQPTPVAIGGRAGLLRFWTERLVERLGFAPVGEGMAAEYGIDIEEDSEGLLFRVRLGGEAGHSARSFQALAKLLSENR